MYWFIAVNQTDTPIGQIKCRILDNGLPNLFAVRVRQEHQSKGIGTSLILSMEKLLKNKGYTETTISVGVDNPSARKLYERLGYSVITEITEQTEYADEDGNICEIDMQVHVMNKLI